MNYFLYTFIDETSSRDLGCPFGLFSQSKIATIVDKLFKFCFYSKKK